MTMKERKAAVASFLASFSFETKVDNHNRFDLMTHVCIVLFDRRINPVSVDRGEGMGIEGPLLAGMLIDNAVRKAGCVTQGDVADNGAECIVSLGDDNIFRFRRGGPPYSSPFPEGELG